MMEGTPAKSASRSDRRRVVIATSIGNALEWFDYTVFGFFAVIMAKQFFPAQSETASLLLAFGTFGVTFFMRPVGAIIMGSFADRYGRKTALTFTIFLMMVGTAIIAFAPAYESIGILAPLLVVLARLIQGFSVGGEFGSATAFLAEQDPDWIGFYSSWQATSQALTGVLATGFGAILSSALSPEQMEAGGWRIPFVFGLLIGPVAYYIRLRVNESYEFQAIETSRTPLLDVLTQAKGRFLVALGVVVLGTAGVYIMIFMPTYAMRQLGLDATGAFAANLISGVVQIALIPIVGALSDKYGRLPIASGAAIAIMIGIYPSFAWLSGTPTITTLIVVQVGFGAVFAGYAGLVPALLSELFPTRIRATGTSTSYSIGVALFGAFAPFITEWLIASSGNKTAPSFYLMAAALISLASLVAARRFGIR